MNNTQALLIVAVAALVTIAIRFIPFLVMGNRETPAYIDYLGKYLSYSIMAMLVVYCLKGTSFTGPTHGIPEIVSVAAVILLHIWKRNTLVSIVAGTACYMLLLNFVF